MDAHKSTEKEINRRSAATLAAGAATLLVLVLTGDMELSQKAIVVGIAATSGLLLFIGAKLRK